MIKLSKRQYSNIFSIAFILLFLFTPLRFHLGVYMNKLIVLTPFTTPSTLEDNEQVILESYDWKLLDDSGIQYDFEDERGKVVFINFWATWCPPCVAELPSLQKLYDVYGDKITFLFIASDEVENVNAFMDKKGFTFPVRYKKSEYPDGLEHTSIPTTYIIDKLGKIVLEKSAVADWNSKEVHGILEELLE